MIDLTIKEPKAYLAGCLKGDAWLDGRCLGLRVKDRDFALSFSCAVRLICGSVCDPKQESRGYWVVRRFNSNSIFNSLEAYIPKSNDEKRSWLLGWFDSEGNANHSKLNRGENCFNRRISMYSTNRATVDFGEMLLNDLGMRTGRGFVKPSDGHYGDRPVIELRLLASQVNFKIFRDLIGSNIARKMRKISAMVSSYQDVSEYCRMAQLKGAASRKANRIAGKSS